MASSKMAAKQVAAKKNKTRTHIWYEVETGGAIEKKDIPFDIAVMSDLSGDNNDKRDLRDRQFVEVSDPGKFDDLVKNIKPKLELEVDFGEPGNETTQNVSLNFKSMEDFGPEAILAAVAKQVSSVAAMKELREALLETRQNVNVSREFEKKLKDMLSKPESLAQLKAELDKEKNS
jgi:type VI secretion system protein ImpB